MTKEEVLQKVNDYCNEKSYTNETLTDDFKDKFSDFFSKKNEQKGIDDDGVIDDLKFSLNTAFSAASKILTSKNSAWNTKENEYKKKIEELSKKVNPIEDKKLELPDDVKEQLKRLTQYEEDSRKREKFEEILGIAKKSIREDLHKSFANYAKDFAVNTNEDSNEQAKKLVSRFQEIFKDSIGDIKPLAPKITIKQETEFIENLPKIKL